MKHKVKLLLCCVLAWGALFSLTACDGAQGGLGNLMNGSNGTSESSGSEQSVQSVNPSIISKTENMIVLTVEKSEGKTLLDAMELLKADGALTYEMADGMVTKMEGKANLPDYSACWMLYTSDTELANTEWGTVEYEGKTYGSAIVGASALELIDGGYYIWCYKTF